MKDEVESLMDTGLASYCAEPSAGLASRIVRETGAVRSQAEMRSCRTWGGAIAAAGLLLLFALHHGIEHSSTLSSATAAATPQSHIFEPTKLTQASRTVRHVRRRIPAIHSVYVPAAPTEQEMTLLALATEHPREALALVAMNRADSTPLGEERASALSKLKDLDVDSLPLLASKPLPTIANDDDEEQ
jgi:hypothetical protein